MSQNNEFLLDAVWQSFEQEVRNLVDERIEAYDIESGLTEDEVAALIDERDTGITEERAKEIASEHVQPRRRMQPASKPETTAVTDAYSASEVNDLLSDLESLLDKLDPKEVNELLSHLDDTLAQFEANFGLKAILGPDVPDDGHSHSTAGWGTVFETDGPIDLGRCTVVSNQTGTTVVEVHGYDEDEEDVTGVVDSTKLPIEKTGEQRIDLDLHVPEAGTYLLTRDYHAVNNDEIEPDERVSFWRTNDDWDGWGDVANGMINLKMSAHPEFDGHPQNWYYFFQLNATASAEE